MPIPPFDVKSLIYEVKKSGFAFILAVLFIANALGYLTFPWERIFTKLTAIGADITTVLDNQNDDKTQSETIEKLLRGTCQNVAKDEAALARCN